MWSIFPKGKQQENIEEIDDDELQELVLEAQREALLKESARKRSPKRNDLFQNGFLVDFHCVALNTFVVIFEIYSIPAIEFLKASAKLSAQEDIATYKKSVVVISTGDSKGTGFSISSDGTILTNYHVVEGNDTVMVTFPDDGRFTANVVANIHPSILLY